MDTTLTKKELSIIIRLVTNLINVDDNWENRKLLIKLQNEYNKIQVD